MEFALASPRSEFQPVSQSFIEDLTAAAVSVPTILTTNLFSTVQNWALTPHGTFNPASRHSLSRKSVLKGTDEIGTFGCALCKPRLVISGTIGGMNSRHA